MVERGIQAQGHPKGLWILFGTEMWERFSFYGMKALLIFYLTKYHLFNDETGNGTVGSYAALVYALPILGGFLADKYLGFRKAVIFGAVLLILGHFGMAYEGAEAYINKEGIIVRDNTAIQGFYFSMALIIMGVGFLKPNISAIVGELYEKNDTRRDAGFTIFYMGINIGSFISTLLCGWLGETYGWKYGFGVAGVGMIIGLLIFLKGQKYLAGKAEPKDPALLKAASPVGFINNEWLIYILSLGGVVICWQLVQRHAVVGGLLGIVAILSVCYILWYIFTKSLPQERDRMIYLLILFFFSVIFWSIYEQQYTSLNLFADRIVNRFVGSTEVNASQFLSLNALFIFMLAPVFAWIWVKLAQKNKEPNGAVKFGIGIILAALAFLVLWLGLNNINESNKVAAIWLVLAYLLFTLGELCISPVGLSTVTKLSVPKLVGFMMGVWFLATAAAEFIAAQLANIASIELKNGEIANVPHAVETYAYLFKLLFYGGLITGGLLLFLSSFLKKLTHGIK